jgi:hypothetical protein
MQAGGLLPASKMPAATAATLVDAMEDPEEDSMASPHAISHTPVHCYLQHVETFAY